MSARDNILSRLRQSAGIQPYYLNTEAAREKEWLAQQPELGDLAEAFVRGQEAVGGQVKRGASWDDVPHAVAPWVREHGIRHAMTGTEPRLEPLRAYLGSMLGVEMRSYDRPLAAQKTELFNTDCGITCSEGGIAETGSVILKPSPAEPRLLSLAMPVHLVLVEAAKLVPTLADYIAGGDYHRDVPTNLVIASGPSRTADIELTLTLGVHGPRHFLVVLIG